MNPKHRPIFFPPAAAAGGSAGSLSVITTSWGAANLDSEGWTDWYFGRDISGHAKHKYPGLGLIVGPTFGGLMQWTGGGAGSPIGYDWTGTAEDGPASGASGITDTGNWNLSGAGSGNGVITFPAGVTTCHAKIRMGVFNNTATPPLIRFFLSDSSATEVDDTPAIGGTPSAADTSTFYNYYVTYRAASAGQTLSYRVETVTATCGVWSMLYAYANT